MTTADQKKVYHEEKTEDDVLRRMLADQAAHSQGPTEKALPSDE